MDYWGPWLKPDHPRPAKPGELRWYTTIEGQDIECQGSEAIKVGNDYVKPKSRTFIPARVQDNPYLMATGYLATLQALPEPYRSRLLHGDFSPLEDANIFQVIPDKWVRAAQDRWLYADKPATRMSSLGVDPSRGGQDETILSPRYGVWFDEQIVIEGKNVPDGPSAAAHIMRHRDQSPVHLDMLGPPASSIYDILVSNDIPVVPLNGSASAGGATDRSGRLKFKNKRAQWHWEMREALDPDSGYGLCLPPDKQLREDLCSPRWKPIVGGIQIEEKPDIKVRIGRSPDRGDAAIYALAESSVIQLGPEMFIKHTCLTLSN